MITPLQNSSVSLDLLQQFDPSVQTYQKPVGQAVPQHDVVNVTRPELMTDEEAQAVMENVQDTIAESPVDALTVHGGLDLARVMALLADD